MHFLRELLKESNDIVDICIGYDDHCSVYRLPKSTLSKLAQMNKVDLINDFIVGQGKYISSKDDQGDLFLDLTNNDVASFHEQIAELDE